MAESLNLCVCVTLIFKNCGRGECVPWCENSINFSFMSLTTASVTCRQGEQMVPECLINTVKYGGGGAIM